MTRRRLHTPLLCALAIGLAACWTAPRRANQAPGRLVAADAARGYVVYRKACATCHGARGNGKGPSARDLWPRPRDFTLGNYRFRSTPSGELPLTSDLERTLYDGVPGTSMPAWSQRLSPQELRDVIAYIKGFTPDFAELADDTELELVPIPEPVPFTRESIERGARAYVDLKCGECHGKRGEGDGWAKADELRDEHGDVIHAADLTRGVYRSGRTRRALYRSIVTGLAGTPMPSYETATPQQVYDLVNYVLALESDGAWTWLTTPPRWYEPCDWRVPR